MRTLGLSLGLALLCLLPVRAAVLRAAERDEGKVAGIWYITAMASDSEAYLRNKDHLKMAMANIEVLKNGDLNISFAILTPKECMKFESIYKPTGNLDEYHSSDRGDKTVKLLNTDNSSYMIVLATKKKDGKTLRMLRLYSRTQSVTSEVESLFRKLSKENSFTNEMVWILPRQEECRLGEP